MVDAERKPRRQNGSKKDGVTPNERRKRSREAIMAAGRHLFANFSAEGVSVEDVVRAAGIAKQSFYNHFADRSELAKEVMHVARQEIQERVHAAIIDEEDPIRRIALGMCVYARSAIDHASGASIIARLLLEDMDHGLELNRGIVEDLGRALAEGRINIFTMDAGLLLVVGTTQALIGRILKDNSVTSAVFITQQMVTLVLRGLGLPSLEAELIAAQAVDRIIRAGETLAG